MQNNKFFLYIIISLLIHLLIFIAFPLADKAGVVSDNNDSGDFGFIQMVEYQPITQTSQQAGENEVADEENAETESPIKDDKEDEEAEIDNKDKIEDNNTKTYDDQNVNDENNKANENKKNLENINKNQETEDNNTEDARVVDKETEAEDEQVEEKSNSNEKEIMTSENSDVEMDVEEESKEKDDSRTSESGTNESDNNKNSQEEKEEAPPPPPTSGELIANSVTPQYPKDLIGDGKRGTVEFIVNINKSGNINKLTMTNSSGIEQMDRTARLAIERGWEFKSYNLAYSIPIIVTFSLNEEGNPRIDVILGEVDFKEVSN